MKKAKERKERIKKIIVEIDKAKNIYLSEIEKPKRNIISKDSWIKFNTKTKHRKRRK